VRTLEGAIGRSLEEVRAAALTDLVSQALVALGEAVDVFEPAKGGRLAGPAGLALTRIGTKFVREHPGEAISSRARAVAHLTPGIRIPDWTLRLSPWQSFGGRLWLEPHSRVRTAPGPQRELLRRRFGWGPAPGTLAEVAAEFRMTPARATRLERAAVHAAIRGRP
jgi:hypothetical protein